MISWLGVLALVIAVCVVLMGTAFALRGRPGERFMGLAVGLWWIPAIAASVGILLADVVSAIIGVALWAGGAICVICYRALEKVSQA